MTTNTPAMTAIFNPATNATNAPRNNWITVVTIPAVFQDKLNQF